MLLVSGRGFSLSSNPVPTYRSRDITSVFELGDLAADHAHHI